MNDKSREVVRFAKSVILRRLSLVSTVEKKAHIFLFYVQLLFKDELTRYGFFDLMKS